MSYKYTHLSPDHCNVIIADPLVTLVCIRSNPVLGILDYSVLLVYDTVADLSGREIQGVNTRSNSVYISYS